MVWIFLIAAASSLCAAALVDGILRIRERARLRRRLGKKPVSIVPSAVVIWWRRRCEAPMIVRQFPHVIDMVCLSIEAGLDFGAALARIAEQMPDHPMGRCLQKLVGDMRLGKSRAVALRDFRDDLRLPAATRLVGLLIQADMLGTPISGILREEARTLRMDRFQSAERLGQRAGQLLLFPLIFCMMPVVFLVIFGPLFIQFSQTGLGLPGGGL